MTFPRVPHFGLMIMSLALVVMSLIAGLAGEYDHPLECLPHSQVDFQHDVFPLNDRQIGMLVIPKPRDLVNG